MFTTTFITAANIEVFAISFVIFLATYMDPKKLTITLNIAPINNIGI